MKSIKRSIYLDADLVIPLAARAEAEGRSVTKQINIFVRDGLAGGERARHVTIHPPAFDLSAFRGPDPRVRPKK